MKRSLVAAGAALGLLLSAGLAGANVPAGGGLGEPFPVNCPALGGTVMVLSKDHSATAWTLGGVHVVVQSVSGISTGTDPDGTVHSFTFMKTYGTKRNLTPFPCTAHFEGSEDGFTFSTDITVLVAVVPPGG